MARPGKLDRRITIQQATESLDDYGHTVNVWSTFATVWADRLSPRGDERFNSDQRQAFRTVIFRTHWIAGIHEEMRILDDGSTYDIRMIAEDRRENWLEMTARVIDPETAGSGEA